MVCIILHGCFSLHRMGKDKKSKEEQQTSVEVKEKVEAAASSSKEDSIKQAERSMQQKTVLLVSALSDKQLDQYEIFRRSTLPRASVKRLMQSISGTTIPPNAVIAMAGITKVYVGEIVEMACQAREKLNETGPLQPKHIREAVRLMRMKNNVPSTKYKKVITFK